MTKEQISALYTDLAPDAPNAKGFGNPLQYLTIQPTDNCIDLGCGGGFDCQEISKITPSVLGIDIQDKMIDFARLNNPGATYQVADLLDNKLEADSYDKVVSNCAFMHIENKASCLNEVYRLLKKGGWFCFADVTTKKSLPNRNLFTIESDEYYTLLQSLGFQQTFFLEEKHVKINGEYTYLLHSTFIGQK